MQNKKFNFQKKLKIILTMDLDLVNYQNKREVMIYDEKYNR